MATTLDSAESMSSESDVEQNASPVDNFGRYSTPHTESSPPESPVPGSKTLQTTRAWAKEKLKQLTQEEKVICPVLDPTTRVTDVFSGLLVDSCGFLANKSHRVEEDSVVENK